MRVLLTKRDAFLLVYCLIGIPLCILYFLMA